MTWYVAGWGRAVVCTPEKWDVISRKSGEVGLTRSVRLLTRNMREYHRVGRPMSCMPGKFEVINHHNVGSLTIPRASIKWV